MEKKNVWSTADIIKNRNNWTLACDVELLKHIQSLSEKLLNRSHSTLQLLNSFENDVNSTCIAVANSNNRFRALSDTQFIENKIRDDSPEKEEPAAEVQEKKENKENITGKLNEALNNGIQVLRTQYDIIAVTDSDSDDDEPPEVLLKARNPFMSRRLPFIIGSEDFNKYDHLGLVTSSEEEDDENESEAEEDEEEDDTYSKKIVQKSVPVQSDPSKSRTQVIRVSSDSEDSDVSFPENEEPPKRKEIQSDIQTHSRNTSETVQTSYNFVDHLNGTLRNVSAKTVTPLVDDLFSPPPFPAKDGYESLTDDDKSDDSDIFASSKKVDKSETKQTFMSDIFDDDASIEVPRRNDNSSSHVSRKSSIISDNVQSDSVPPALKQSNEKSRQHSNPYTAVPNNKIFSAVNAEISAKLNKKVTVKDDLTSSDEADSVFSKSSSHSDNRGNIEESKKSTHPSVTAAQIIASSAPGATSPTNTLFQTTSSPEDDIFESATPKPSLTLQKGTTKAKVVSLFDDDDDDDDSLDELFSPSSKNTKKAPSPIVAPKSSKELFANTNDLFSSSKGKMPVSEKAPKASIISTSSLLSKKVDLFNDDSDSDDDIFAIINSEKKKSKPIVTKVEIGREVDRRTEITPPEKKTLRDLFLSNAKTSSLIESDDVFESERKDPNIVSQNTENSSFSHVFKEEPKSKIKDLFDTDDESDDIFSAPSAFNESKNEIPPKGLFDSVAEKPEDNNEKLNFNVTCNDESILETSEKHIEVTKDEPLKREIKPNVLSRTEVVKNVSEETNLVTSKNNLCPTTNVISTSTINTSATVNKLDVHLESKTAEEKDEKKDSFNEEPKKFTESDYVTKPETSVAEKTTAEDVNKLSRKFEQVLDGTDGSNSTKLVKNEAPAPSTKAPGKLSTTRSLNINVNALLPGTSWSSISKQVKETVPKSKAEQITPSHPPAETDLLITVAKERPKVSARRRPPSRQVRISKALQSDLFATTAVEQSSDDEVDSTYITASESDSPGNASATKEPNIEKSKSLEDRNKFNLTEKSTEMMIPVSSPPEQTIEKMSLPDEFVPPSMLTSYTKNRPRLPRKRPTSSTVTIESTPTSTDLPSDESKNENKIANDLGNILITASSSREPPAIIESDFKSLLNDLNEDDDLFDDIFSAGKNVDEPTPQVDATETFYSPIKGTLERPDSGNSSLNRTNLFDLSKADALFPDISSTNRNVLDEQVTPSANIFAKNSKTVDKLTSIKISNIDSVPNEFNFAGTLPESATKPTIVTSLVQSQVGSEEPLPKSGQSTMQTEGTTDSVTSERNDKKLMQNLSSLDESESDDELDKIFSKAVATKVVSKKSDITTLGSTKVVIDKTGKKSSIPTTEVSASKNISSSIIKAAGLFDKDSSDDDLFSTTKVSVKQQDSKAPKTLVMPKKISPSPESNTGSVKSKLLSKTNADDLFVDDNDDLFSSNKKSTIQKAKPATKGLFGDDDDDDSLFGSVGVVSANREKSVVLSKQSKSGISVDKVRIVKLRSQAVEKDPLTGTAVEK